MRMLVLSDVIFPILRRLLPTKNEAISDYIGWQGRFLCSGWMGHKLFITFHIYMLRTSLTTDQLYDELFNINSLSLSLFLSLSLSLLLFHYGYRPHKRTFLSTPLLSNRALSMTSMKCIYDEEQIFIILFIFG